MKTTTLARRRAVTAYTGRASYRVPTVKHVHDWQNPMRLKGPRIRWGCLHCPAVDPRWYVLDDMMREAFWGKGVVLGKPVDLDASWTVDDKGFTPDESPYVASGMDGRSTLPQRVPGASFEGNHPDEEITMTPEEIEAEENSPRARILAALSSMTKPEILEAYPKYGMFKSWTKDKMIETVISKELADG